jgi:hypothetical protein
MYVLAAFSIFWFLGIILFISSRKDEKVLYKKTGCYQKETIKRLEAAEELRKFSIELENERKGTIETYQKQIDAVLQEAKRAYLALKKSFEKILDERDWQYVDVLIYYFQTGRATTVKESLQLLDRQLQTNQIVDAVQQTSVAITESINQFKDTFVTCATQIISNQDEMISQMRVQTALLSKIRASSSSLAADVGYVKAYY